MRSTASWSTRLRGVSFTLQPGDRLGLVGGNGAGKTTLLRALAGIYEPIAGHVTVIRGALHTLLDTGLGMNMDLTGRENIGLRGLYAGLERAAIALLEDDVQAFAELGGFLDMPVRTYSSGMLVRLGFALATAIDPQVLLMDEWFLAGDSGFMAKATAVVSKPWYERPRSWCCRRIIRRSSPPGATGCCGSSRAPSGWTVRRSRSSRRISATRWKPPRICCSSA